jgi:hypothetical protein
MAFVAGDAVTLLPHFAVGQGAFMLGGGGEPLLGFVDAVASPSVRVTWQNGLTTQYLDDGAQLLSRGSASGSTNALLHTRVTVTGLADGAANPRLQGASEGLVVGVFEAGGADFVVIKFSANDIATFLAAQVS